MPGVLARVGFSFMGTVAMYGGSSKKNKGPQDLNKAGLFCGSFLQKGEVFAYVGSVQNLKDLKACM